MFLKNVQARLITINGKFENGQRVESYKILPGKNPVAVEVPDELCETAFVKALLDDGALVQVAGPSIEDGGDDDTGVADYSGLEKSDLINLCENRGIEVIKQDTVRTLTAKLKAKDAEEKGANE